MPRILIVLAFSSLFCAAPSFCGEPSPSALLSQQQATPGTLIAFSHDPNCPGCRAFLTGYEGGGCSCNHSAGCSACDAANGGAGGGAGGGEGGPITSDDMVAGEQLLASDYGFGFGFESGAPGMIGDFFGGSYQMNVITAGQHDGNTPGAPADVYTSIAAAAGDRRFKIAENYSPFPLDRIFVNYNHFHNALQTADYRNANLNRVTMGVEKTFLDGMYSFELRMPFANGLNSTQTAALGPTTDNNVSGEVGNLGFVLKRLLTSSDTLRTSAGLGMVFPTGPDARIFDQGGTHIVTIGNDAFYLQPFVGAWWTPNDRVFGQFAAQMDFDVRGNRIDYAQDVIGPVATIQDQTLLFLDASFGYWLFHDPSSDAVITGIAPMVEIHHNSTIQDPDSVIGVGPGGGGPDSYLNPNNRLDVLNLTGALRLELAGMSYLTVFGVAPLRTNEEKLFDAEFGVQYSRLY